MNKSYNAHATKDNEPIKNKSKEDSSNDEEYVLISTLTSMITHGRKVCLVDCVASKQMIGFKHSFTNLTEEDTPHKVKLGDDYQYPIKGVREASYKLDSSKSIKMKDVLYVP